MSRPRKVPAVRRSRGRARVSGRMLRVDMGVCDGYGVCAELLPELIRLDDWGYPVVADRAIPPELAQHACRAVAFCPRLALSLVPAAQAR
jgi:ferredoxin